MTRRVYVCGPRGTVLDETRLLSVAGFAIVRGYDPVVVGVDLDAAAAIGAGGGEFWAIEVPPPVVYTPDVSRAYREWEQQTVPGSALRLRRSKTWPMWEAEIMAFARAPVRTCGPDDIPF